MSVSPTEPTVSEVEQSEVLDVPTVPVRVEGPVNIRSLPGVIGNHGKANFANTTDAVEVLNEEPRRKRVLLVAKSGEIWVGTSQQQVVQELCMLLPINVVLEVTHKESLWAKPESVATATLAFVHELWSS